eukprot:10472278-Alexandrium_andersonii.AAC.1
MRGLGGDECRPVQCRRCGAERVALPILECDARELDLLGIRNKAERLFVYVRPLEAFIHARSHAACPEPVVRLPEKHNHADGHCVLV